MGNIIFYFCIHCIDKGAKAIRFLWERIVFSTNVVGASIGKKMHVPTQKNEPQPKPPSSYKC